MTKSEQDAAISEGYLITEIKTLLHTILPHSKEEFHSMREQLTFTNDHFNAEYVKTVRDNILSMSDGMPR